MVQFGVSSSDPSEQTYHQRIKSRRQRRPGLANLDAFLDRAAQYLPPSERRSRFDIEVVHVLEHGIIRGPIECNNRKDFDQAAGLGAPADRISTIILVEDLSYDVIEYLGITYNLPPEFFALHLQGSEAYRTGIYMTPQCPDMELLSSYIAEAPFYSLQVHRYYHFPGGLEEVQSTRRIKTNGKSLEHRRFKFLCKLRWNGSVPRPALVTQSLPNVVVKERVTIYTTQDNEGRDIGIVLTDRLLKRENPLGCAYPMTFGDLLDETLTLTPSNLYPDHSIQVSIRTELLSYLLHLPPSAAQTLFTPKSTPLLLITPLIHTMTCFSAMFLADTRGGRISIGRIMLVQPDDTFPKDPDSYVTISRRLCRNLELYRHDLEYNLQTIRARAPDLADELGTDIKSLCVEMSWLLTRLENDVQFLASNFAIQQAKLVNILANVGILFLPVTSVAAVLSLPDSRGRYVVFGAVTVPIVLMLSFWLFILNKPYFARGWSVKM